MLSLLENRQKEALARVGLGILGIANNGKIRTNDPNIFSLFVDLFDVSTQEEIFPILQRILKLEQDEATNIIAALSYEHKDVFRKYLIEKANGDNRVLLAIAFFMREIGFSKHSNSIKPEVDNIIKIFESGNIQLLQQKLYELYCKFNKSGGGKLITSYPEKDRLCEVFNLYLQYDWINDPDIREVWAENAFYCIAEYFKVARTNQDYFAAGLDLFLTCCYGKDSLKTKFNDILYKARVHPAHSIIFNMKEYNGGADYLIREFAFFSATIISPVVKNHPNIISHQLQSSYQSAKSDFEFATVPPSDIMKKMSLISAIIGSILNDM